MDFIERWFGVSPDGGDGSLEMLYLGAIAIAAVAIVGRRSIMRRLIGYSGRWSRHAKR